jgi:hypothetical protein
LTISIPSIKLTVLTGQKDARLTKAFTKNSTGNITKDSTPSFSCGSAEQRTIISLKQLQTEIENLKQSQAICLGGFDKPICEVVPKSQLTPDKEQAGVRARSKEHMKEFNNGIALLDYDPNPYMPKQLQCRSAADLMNKLATAIPVLRDVGYLGVDSSSAGIIDSATGNSFETAGGLHVYVSISGNSLKEFRRFIEVKLWNAGMGYIAFGRNGSMLTRTIVDLAVFSPERLIYEASPVLGEGIEKQARQWEYKSGPKLSLDLTLTDAEVREFNESLQAAKQSAEAIETSATIKEQYLNDSAKELAEHKGIPITVAKESVKIQEDKRVNGEIHNLFPSDLIEIDGEQITVGELESRGEELDGTQMPDPIEGNSYGTTTAKFYHNEGLNPVIRSFAHGEVTIYRIVAEDPAAIPSANVIADTASSLTIQPRTDNYIEYLNTLQPLDPSGFPNVRVNSKGTAVPMMTLANVDHLLRGYGVSIQYDVIKKTVEFSIPGLTASIENYKNAAINHITSLGNLNGLKGIHLPDFISTLADNYRVNPVAEWITSKSWEGVDRIPAICNTLHLSDEYPESLRNTLVHKFLLSAVAAATVPSGFFARGVLVLKGKQSIGKTSWLKALVSQPVLRDKYVLSGHHLDAGDKDSKITAITSWICELGELDSSFKKDVARIKGFITNSHDKVRRPYAKGDSEYQRRTVFCASVNDDNFLVDDTGNSRWWTVSVTRIDYEHTIDMQQVYAQLAVQLENGAQWWLSKEDEALLELQNRNYRSVSSIKERVLEAMNMELPTDQWQTLSASQVLQHIGIKSPSNPQCRECGSVLREYFGQPKKINGIMKWRVPIEDGSLQFQCD